MTPARAPAWLFTCEHGGNTVPPAYRRVFAGHQRLLASHRGWDAGALPVARQLARATQGPLVAATTTRLLVDLNRSAHNPAAFSEISRTLARAEREALLAQLHRSHWERVRAAIEAAQAPVVHVAVHSFTPVWQGRERGIDVGLLYDPKRPRERALGRAWQRALARRRPELVIRRNAPYRGNADGLATGMRREYADADYAGFELELNQARLAEPAERRALAQAVLEALLEARREVEPAS